MILALSWPAFGAAEVREPVRTPAALATPQLDALVQAAREGDLAAFEQLYRRTRQDVHRTLFQLVGPSSELEDLVQQVYLQLTSALRRFRGDARFSTFLHGICANVAMNWMRTRRRRPEDPVEQLPEQPSSDDPERAAETRKAAALMQRVLDGMAPKKRVVFVYHELMGLTAEEIAQAVDTSPNTVRSRLHHARLEFAELLAGLRKEGALP